MAFTNSPSVSTYTTKRLPLAYPLRLRPANQNWYAFAPYQVQDEGMVNSLPVKIAGSEALFGQTRPGLEGTYIFNTGENGLVRGIYVWEKSPGTTYYFAVVGTKVYTTSGDPLIGSNWSQVNTLLTVATTPVRFTEYIDDVNTKKLIMVDGVEGYIFTTNAAGTKITDADFPTPHVPFPVFLDGYLFLAKANTGDIYNSDLNAPDTWTAGSFISTEVYPDDIQALLKVDNFIVAVGIQGCEYFYDAGNPTASPLARDEGGILPFGTIFPNSIAYNKNSFTMLANTNDGQSVFITTEGRKYKVIDSSGIVPMYNRMINNPNLGFEIPAANCRGNYFRNGGVLYYTFLLDGARGGAFRTALFDMCYAYSFDTSAWTELQYGDDTTDRDNRYAFPIQCTASNTTGELTTFVGGNVGTSNIAFFSRLNDLSGQDVILSLDTVDCYQEWRTPNLDFETMNRKSMNRLGVDIECGDSTLQPAIEVMYNDYDFNYNTWSAGIPFPAQATAVHDYFPFITQLGSFRRRALRFITVSGKQLTARFIETDINRGQQ